MTSKFDSDLKGGKLAEEVVRDILIESGYTDAKLHDTNLRDSNSKPTPEGLKELRKYDIISPVLTVEVKNDLASKEWNRAFFELFCNGKPSGPNATEADLWVHFFYGDTSTAGIWIINREVLRHYVHLDRFDKAYQVPSCGDSGLSSGFAFFPEWFQDKFTQVAKFAPNGELEHYSGDITRSLIQTALFDSAWHFPEKIEMTL